MQKFFTLSLLFPVLTLTAIALFIGYYWVHTCRPRRGTTQWIALQGKDGARPRMTFSLPCHPMARKDALPMLLLTAVYAATAFWNLGSFQNPQSFARLDPADSYVYFSLDKPVELSRIMYYPGLNTGRYALFVSDDQTTWYSPYQYTNPENNQTGYFWYNEEAWNAAPAGTITPSGVTSGDIKSALQQGYADLFKWLDFVPNQTITAQYFSIVGVPDSGKDWVDLGELALYDRDGQRISADRLTQIDDAAKPLFDEQQVIPTKPSWENSTYFDEIYHARTALEHLENIYPYEISHPPLGKLILSIGVSLFGMVPFGWRFMGTLFGVLMLPLLYVFLKNLFGKTPVAFCGTALFAFDFMHLTQTRIATIDTYGVFFILGMYFFLYRYLTLPAGTSFRKGVPMLALSGLFWGLGTASKWTVIYGGVGLAILYFVGLFFKIRDWPQGEDAPRFGPWLWKTLGFSVLCFVFVPVVIYTLSYLPYAIAKGDTSLTGLLTAMWDNQTYMFNYHNGVHDFHPYSSRWYQWVVNARPILYYLDSSSVPGMKSAFGAFSNPVVCWSGLLAMVIMGIHLFKRHSGKALFILVGYFSQLAPWFFIGRTTFEYHYFPSILFLVLALAYLFDDLFERAPKKAALPVYALTGGAAGLYALFYPVLTGLAVPVWYSTNLLRWFPSWPF